MLHERYENKMLDGGYDPKSREELIAERERLLRAAALESDSLKRAEVAVEIARIDHMIKQAELQAEAEAQIAFRRLVFLKEQNKQAVRDAQEFQDNCEAIAGMMLKKYSGAGNCNLNAQFGTDPEDAYFRSNFHAYYQKIFKSLTFDQAKEQAAAIYKAMERHSSDFEELSFTPKPPVRREVLKLDNFGFPRQ